MFPLPRAYVNKERTTPVHIFVGEITEEHAPQLDLGKKVSVPQDLMMEELSLPINRGSRLYQQRQKRVQRFVLEHPLGYKTSTHNAEGKENYPAELHGTGSGKGAPPKVPKKTDKVLQMSRALNPDALAPGYSGPLREVPPEKFNITAIPKCYQSPWQEFLSSEDYQVDSKSHLPEPPRKVNNFDMRSFNRTPTPFGGPLLNEVFPGFEMNDAQMEPMSGFQIMLNRPSFNRTPQGWVHVLPESEDL
uniref:Myozenin 3 n=1 Tax=Salvator merianae TaxID=96440 RepID=A0A8D0DUB8_SALMN